MNKTEDTPGSTFSCPFSQGEDVPVESAWTQFSTNWRQSQQCSRGSAKLHVMIESSHCGRWHREMTAKLVIGCPSAPLTKPVGRMPMPQPQARTLGNGWRQPPEYFPTQPDIGVAEKWLTRERQARSNVHGRAALVRICYGLEGMSLSE
eukprot:5934448-Amphidinium_carterae.1